MKKIWWLPISLFSVGLLFLVVTNRRFLSLSFMPQAWRNNFLINANIIPSSDDSRSLFLAINPGFRVEFGDRDNPTSAYVRFEVTESSESIATADVSQNLLDNFTDVYQAFRDYQPGASWQLFSVGVDETQVFAANKLADDQAMIELIRSTLNEDLEATADTNLIMVASEKEAVTTETVATRYQGYDVIENRAVAGDVDLNYQIDPGRGVLANIVIGDRADFDAACLKLLQMTGSNVSCDLPYNRFSFLLQLDPGEKLLHSPVAIDGGANGSYYLTQGEERFLFRFINPTLIDAAGKTSQSVAMEVRPGELDGQTVDDYYIVTLIADLNWLLDSERVFPVKLQTGFLIDNGELFFGEASAD